MRSGYIFEGVEEGGQLAPAGGLHGFESGLQCGQTRGARGQRADVAGTCGVKRDAGEKAFEIEDAGEGATDFLALDQIAVRFGDGFVARFDRSRCP